MKKTEERETEIIINGTPDLTKIPEEIFELFIAELTESIMFQEKGEIKIADNHGLLIKNNIKNS